MAEVNDNSSIQLFEDQKIRTAWDAEKEEWYFSIIDVISVLTGTANPRRYWSDLKRKLKAEGANELYEKIVQLKMLSSDGKRYKTDVANTEQLLRIIQSIPSPKAEPFKAWLAMVGKERIEETIDPEQAIDRALDTYLKKGYSEEWIHQRLLAIRIRNELTDEWKKRGVQKGKEYAILTDEISRAWSGMTTGQYKRLKGLTKENLRDNMTDLELVLTMLAEASTTDISKTAKPQTFEENKQVAKRGGKVAGIARQALEAETGKPVITEKNMRQMEMAPFLKADGLEDGYKVLADFNGTVLAGVQSKHGVHFVTWDWAYGHTGVCHGHYFMENYAGAKQDFAIRSGLIQKERLFTPEQMTEIYRCCADSVDGDFFELTGEQEKMIRSVQQQIEECVPDLDERIRQQEEALEQVAQQQTM